MVQRTARPFVIVDKFTSVNDWVDRVKLGSDFVGNSRGGVFTESGKMERIFGKQMISTTPGRVLTVKQLMFTDDTNVVLYHTSTLYLAERDTSALSILVVQNTSGRSPMGEVM